MKKQILVLSASPRKGGNSDVLCDRFICGAIKSGHAVEKLYVKNKKIAYCIGCNYCKKNRGHCIHKDDMTEILDKMIEADSLVFASPVYFYTVNGQLKTLIDRTYARLEAIENKEFYYILAGAADKADYFTTAIDTLHGFSICTPNAKEKGTVLAIGTGDYGDVKSTVAMQQAYEMGKYA